MKILNCITNSFFRTIGRILAYLAIGALLVALLSKAHLPSFEEIINDSLFMKVNASTNQRIQISNPLINNDSVTVPSIGWYVSGNNYYYQMNTQNPDTGNWNQVNYDFDTITFPTNTKSMTIGLYVHNSDSLTQEYEYAAYSEGYMIYTSGKNLYSLSLYYDGADGFNYCDPVGNNGEFFYFTCPVVTNTFNRFALTIHTNKTSYNFNSFFKFGIRSAITLDMEGNNISDLINAETSNTNAIIANQNSNNQAIIANQNSNNQAVINNQNANTNATIENQNQNTQQQINSQMVCTKYDNTQATYKNYTISTTGTLQEYIGFNASDFINIEGGTIKLLSSASQYNTRACYYNINKQLISCFVRTDVSVGNLTIPQNASYFRYTVLDNENKPQYEICQNGNQALSNSLNDTNVSDSTNQADSFFSNFSTTDQGGLSGIITAPLSAIQSLTSSTCSPLVIPLPYIDENLTLPCMRSIYESFFGNFIYLYDTITIGIISYWVIVRIFNLVKDFKNPDHDEIEVLDL